MNNIVELFVKNKEVNRLLEDSKKQNYNYLVNGGSYNQGLLLTYATFLESGSFVVYIAPNLYKANMAYESFCHLAGYENVSLYIIDEIISTELIAISDEFRRERINTLKNIFQNNKKIIVTHVSAVLRPVVNKNRFKNSIINIETSDTIKRDDLLKKLVKNGFVRTPTTTSIGEFSVRGEIIDVYDAFYKKPIRINFFDDEIETIKFFDIETQKSSDQINKVSLFPNNELIIEDVSSLKEKILNVAKDNEFVNKDLENLHTLNNLERINKYIKYIDEDYCTVLDYIDKKEKIVFYEDVEKLKDSYVNTINDVNNFISDKDIPKKLDLMFFFDYNNIFYNIEKRIYLSEYKKSMVGFLLDEIYSINGYLVIDYHNDIRLLTNDIKTNIIKNKLLKTYIFCFENKERLNLVNEVFKEQNLNINISESFEKVVNNSINFIVCENAIGYGLYNEYELLTEKEIFKHTPSKKVKYRSNTTNSSTINSKDDLRIGDYVVHYDYGIGQYKGIKTIELNNIKNDYIRLQYEDMELYIPVEKIVLLEKYQGSEDSIPKLTKLGTSDWEKKKKGIREKLESIAKDLIDLQIQREAKKGYTYSKDNEFQTMFEDDFEFDETIDQLKITDQIKEDMEKGSVIDRLICGDVGYGKTEIAMRIAFKTVFSGKQVAYLAPTTILSRQHYYTFKNRFEKYGIRVELLNRLVPLKKQNKTLEELKNKEVDVVIGTHRLLSDDIHFKDLGLLIVDEEQRFGVVHKEIIKRMKVNVNVLTLTATPIPRTLQMAVMGVRQLSLLETPPQDRYPIQTYVLEYNEIVIKEAIYRELSRGGQIFYLHNTISDLELVAKRLKKLVPELKICIGHGKMDRDSLEDTIQSFIDKEYDLLLCTTIIETGIDIPNTNTLIIDEADKLGLSQIYQIRGRVGRSDRVAYAYLTYRPNKVLTQTGTKRLSAIKEFTTLGSGYKIAVRDLAIRGAGDILGKEQSGFINSVGLDMYMKMLDEALNKAKGITVETPTRYTIDIAKHVDEKYVDDDAIKILIHKEISNIEQSEVDPLEYKEKIILEFTDRFGKLNDEILLYIEERYLETLLRKYKVKNIMETSHLVTIVIPEEQSNTINGEQMFMTAYNISDRFNFEYRNRQMIIKITKRPNKDNLIDKDWIYLLSKLLEKLSKKKV